LRYHSSNAHGRMIHPAISSFLGRTSFSPSISQCRPTHFQISFLLIYLQIFLHKALRVGITETQEVQGNGIPPASSVSISPNCFLG
jgi:hypothetical protein